MTRNRLSVTIIFLLTACLFLTGCSARSAASADDFQAAATEAGYTLTDNTEGATGAESFLSATNDSGAELHFVVTSAMTDAQSLYSGFKQQIQAGGNKAQSLDSDTYCKYSVTNGEIYYYLARVNNTVLYVKVPSSGQATAQEVISAINY